MFGIPLPCNRKLDSIQQSPFSSGKIHMLLMFVYTLSLCATNFPIRKAAISQEKADALSKKIFPGLDLLCNPVREIFFYWFLTYGSLEDKLVSQRDRVYTNMDYDTVEYIRLLNRIGRPPISYRGT